MPVATNTGTRDLPLQFAKKLTEKTNLAWDDGDFFNKTTQVTQDLLRFWFSESFTDLRSHNFHRGQRQAILNTIYAHEILKSNSVFSLYSSIAEEVLAKMDLTYLRRDKFDYPKYCMKMATGTGKTWVLAALLIWQYLNAKYEEKSSGRYSKNFLLVAPGLIVYERLLDSYLGKSRESGIRDFTTSDFYQSRELFIPDSYRDEVLGFIQSNVVQKEEIGKKITGEGLIAITNWHRLAGVEEEIEQAVEQNPLDDPSQAVKELFPITPGISAGQSLETLDSKYLRGGELEYLKNLPNLIVFNDEAHHIHETKKEGIVSEVEWQRSLDLIAENKGNKFIQIDFSATPFDVTGGKVRTRHYFPHIIVDFDLRTAIYDGLVKTITLDRRKELLVKELDFKAIRDGKNVIALSEGQKLMLRAGLKKLRILEKEFVEFSKDASGNSNKYPKMLVICEDTDVSPLVTQFLIESESLGADDVIQIDSDRKGSVPKDEWKQIKQRLFSLDQHSQPKVVVSVLMLREGFDVSNICVIVPLRSSQAPILLEQVIGRGLRLMWREPEYKEIKDENRELLLKKKEEPNSYLDILSIVEHPAFINFYEELIKDELLPEIGDPTDRESILGDLITIDLKPEYEKYDLYWPYISQEKEEFLDDLPLSIETMASVDWYDLEQLKKYAKDKGETFFSEEMTVKTQFGDYEVAADLFTAKSYNEFLMKMAGIVTHSIVRIGTRSVKVFPTMQINKASLVKLLDQFIREKLFKQNFDPLKENNWKILLLSEQGITEHIVKEVSKALYQMQTNIKVENAVVNKQYFSQMAPALKMRENFSVPLTKVIYQRLAYPSNKGEFEKQFMLACDQDAVNVVSFIKIDEYKHESAHISYIRMDGILSRYFPDFIVRTKNKIHLIETKAQKDMTSENVVQKQKAALSWVKKINELPPDVRDNLEWSYCLLGEDTFYNLKRTGANILEILELAKLSEQRITGKLL